METSQAHPHLFDFARPILISGAGRPQLLNRSIEELERLAGRPVRPGLDVAIVRLPEFDDAAGFDDALSRSRLHAHLRAAEVARAEGVESALVVEDDVIFHPRWPAIQPGALGLLDATDWAVAHLGDSGADRSGVSAPASGFSWMRSSADMIGCHAYLVRGRFLPRWIDHLRSITTDLAGARGRYPTGPDGALNAIAGDDPSVVRLMATPSVAQRLPAQPIVATPVAVGSKG